MCRIRDLSSSLSIVQSSFPDDINIPRFVCYSSRCGLRSSWSARNNASLLDLVYSIPRSFMFEDHDQKKYHLLFMRVSSIESYTAISFLNWKTLWENRFIQIYARRFKKFLSGWLDSLFVAHPVSSKTHLEDLKPYLNYSYCTFEYT